jgi:hypothetical protein
MSSRYAFELDHTSTYLRNRDMRAYYQKLNEIITRKKNFLPKINLSKNTALSAPKNKNPKNNHPLKFATHSIYEKYVIRRDNAIIFNKLDKIHNRSCQAIDDEAKIQKYLDIKKNTREGLRKINQNLLKESNIRIKNHLYQTKPVLNALKMKTDFLVTRGYYENLKKLRPNQSVSQVFLTKNESDHLDRYLDSRNHNKQTMNSNEYNKQLISNKKSLKKLGYGLKGSHSFCNLKKN